MSWEVPWLGEAALAMSAETGPVCSGRTGPITSAASVNRQLSLRFRTVVVIRTRAHLGRPGLNAVARMALQAPGPDKRGRRSRHPLPASQRREGS